MNFYGRSFHILAAGHVICPVMYPDLFDYIVEKNGREELDAGLKPLGMKIANTTGGGSFYLAWEDGTTEARKSISSTARAAQEETARVQAFVTFLLEINDAGGVLSREALVRAAEISNAIDTSAALRESLANVAITLAVKNTATDHSRISGILTKMKDMGYLKLVSKEREEYVVTGKIDMFYDVMEHFACHIGVVEMAVDREEQGSLF
jgi:hypothetical protein